MIGGATAEGVDDGAAWIVAAVEIKVERERVLVDESKTEAVVDESE